MMDKKFRDNVKEINLTSNEPVDEFHVLVKILEILNVPYGGDFDLSPIDSDTSRYHYNLRWDDDVLEERFKDLFTFTKLWVKK